MASVDSPMPKGDWANEVLAALSVCVADTDVSTVPETHLVTNWTCIQCLLGCLWSSRQPWEMDVESIRETLMLRRSIVTSPSVSSHTRMACGYGSAFEAAFQKSPDDTSRIVHGTNVLLPMILEG